MNVSFDQPELLDLLLQQLNGHSQERARGQRLAQRYLPDMPTTITKAATAWVNENRPLFIRIRRWRLPLVYRSPGKRETNPNAGIARAEKSRYSQSRHAGQMIYQAAMAVDSALPNASAVAKLGTKKTKARTIGPMGEGIQDFCLLKIKLHQYPEICDLKSHFSASSCAPAVSAVNY